MDLNERFGALDLVVLVASIAAGALIGLYFKNKNKSVSDYLLGDQKMSLLPVAMSLMTSFLSGLTLLGCSAELYYQGASYFLMSIAILLAGPIAAVTLLPTLYRLNEISLYSYLYKRYGFAVKYFVTVVFIAEMIIYNAAVVYLPAMAVHSIFGINKHYSILLFGMLCVLYSIIGGLKAVVWADFLQGLVMLGSVAFVAMIGTQEAGGFNELYQRSFAGGRLNVDDLFKVDLSARHSLISTLVGGTLVYICLTSLNQIQVQRVLSLPTLRLAQWSLVLCSLFGSIVVALSSYLGLVIYSAYGPCDPFLGGEIPRRDIILLHYVAHRLGRIPGLRGLLVAGIVSATLSTLSSFANSMAALALQDFVKPLHRKLYSRKFDDKQSLLLAKTLTGVFGVLCVLLAYVIERLNSRILQSCFALLGAIGVPFLVAFVLGIYTKFTNSKGILTAMILSISFGVYVTFMQAFVVAALEPNAIVYHNQQCPFVYNKTLDSTELSTSILNWSSSELVETGSTEAKGFQLAETSYLILPIMQFAVVLVVAPVVSLLTGGSRQKVPDEYVVG